jgi:site-specific DNA-methyltransferase (adenine-specific)
MMRRTLPRRQILDGDAEQLLRTLPSGSVDCVITSPPYYLLRDYSSPNQIGLESTVDDWVKRLIAVSDQLSRVLKASGGFWLNLGDSYSRDQRYGAPPKGLLLGPERLLLSLADRGWIVRNKTVWSKSNPMPTSVRDRLSCTWEPVYFLVRSPHYFFDLDAIREPHLSKRTAARHPLAQEKYSGRRPSWAGPLAGANDGLARAHAAGRVGHPRGKNPGDVWRLAKSRYRDAHFATYPPGLLTKPILATCPERACSRCGQPWHRQRPSCSCRVGWRRGVVLDPFFGAGTTGLEAERLGRDWVGIDINPDYRDLALERITRARAQQKEVMHERRNA